MSPPPATPLTSRPARSRVLPWFAAWGPGLLVMLADTDAGNVVAAAQAGARWSYRLLPLLVLLIPLLYMVQELAVRLGIHTGRGHGELIRERLGARWAWLAAAMLAIAAIGSMVTEFTAVAGIGEMHGLSRSLSLPLAATLLLAVVLTGSYRRIERAALAIGLFELAFLVVAWRAHPDLARVASQAAHPPLDQPGFLYLGAGLIGATFNPWMIFYQQSAVADKGLLPDDHRAARWDTATGAVLTQLLTAAVLVAAASTLGDRGVPERLQSVGEIASALSPALGERAGRLIFSVGVLGAALVAAIVASLALTWGLGEVAGLRRSLEHRALRAPWFSGLYALCVTGSAALVWAVPDLIRLNLDMQVLNAFMLPLALGILVVLALKALPEGQRLRGGYLWLWLAVAGATCAFAWLGAGSAGLAP